MIAPNCVDRIKRPPSYFWAVTIGQALFASGGNASFPSTVARSPAARTIAGDMMVAPTPVAPSPAGKVRRFIIALLFYFVQLALLRTFPQAVFERSGTADLEWP
jgi:hypothetical protein